jgi:hypothetical protein
MTDAVAVEKATKIRIFEDDEWVKATFVGFAAESEYA